MLGPMSFILRILVVLCTSRDGRDLVRIVMRVYVRDAHNRFARLEFAPQAKASWATERALIALEDPRDPTHCRLVLDRKPLRPGRSLAKNGVRDGDTLDLIAADAIPRLSRGSGSRLYAATLARLRSRKP